MDHREDLKQPLEAAVRAGARRAAGARAASCGAWRAPTVSASIRCMVRACGELGQGLVGRGARTGRGHRGIPRRARAAALRSRCSGIRSGDVTGNAFSRALFAEFGAACRERQEQVILMAKRNTTVLSRSRHLRSRGDHSRHGRYRARQDHAGREVCRGRGHAAAGEHFPADGYRGLSARYLRGDESGGDRHRAARRSEDRAASCPGPPSRPRR